MAAVVPDKTISHRGWSCTDQAPSELQIDRAGTRILKALSDFTIGPQRLSSHPDGLSHQAERSQAEENPKHACSLADFHISSFSPEFLFSSSGTANISQITPRCVHFSAPSFPRPNRDRKGSSPENRSRMFPSPPLK